MRPFIVFILVILISRFSFGAVAFPGAEGFGTETRGAYELYETTLDTDDLPTVIKVTNLNNSGSGSFREAVEASGPRIIVFTVGGVITITTDIRITNPYVTIAGQTAPGDGICIRGGTVVAYMTHDVVIRGMRFRPTSISSIGTSAVDERDAFGVWGAPSGTSNDSYNVVFDHNSMSWSADEMGGTWYGAHDVTISNNLMYKPSTLPRPTHNYGPLIGPGTVRATYHHNVLAHASFRTPTIGGRSEYLDYYQGGTDIEVLNNVVYNMRGWGAQPTYGNNLNHTPSNYDDDQTRAVIAGEYHKAGPDFDLASIDLYTPTAYSRSQYSLGYLTDNSQLHYIDNLNPRRTSHSYDNWYSYRPNTLNENVKYDAGWPFTASGVTVIDAADNFDDLVSMTGNVPAVGAYPRDIVDTIAIEEITSGTDFLGTSGSYGTGPTNPAFTSDWRNNQTLFPAYAVGTFVDVDNDNMRDDLEIAVFDSITVTNYAHGDVDGDGYFDIEETFNSVFETGDPGPDTTPPVISGTYPSGALPRGTNQVSAGCLTSEAAVCRYSLTSGASWGDMVIITEEATTSHEFTISGLVNGQSYTRYLLCQDPLGNTSNEAIVNFSVLSEPTTVPISLKGTVTVRGTVEIN